jgi:hypothetical protein
MSDPAPSAIGIIFNEVCVLVRQPSRSRFCQALGSRSVLCCRGAIKERLCWSLRFSALSKEATVSHAGLLNERIVAVCAAGLVAGPWVGLAVGVFVTWLAVARHGLPFGRFLGYMILEKYQSLRAKSSNTTLEILGHFSEGEEIETAGDSFFIVFTQPCL